MDEKKQRSVERFQEEIATYTALAEGLALMPDDLSTKVHLPLVKYIAAQHTKTIEHVLSRFHKELINEFNFDPKSAQVDGKISQFDFKTQTVTHLTRWEPILK